MVPTRFPRTGIPPLLWPQVSRIGPLGAIVLLHLAFFYALQSGLLRHVAQQVLPKEVVVTFITPERQPDPRQPPVPVPKTVPVVKKSATPPPAPIINTTPAPQAIAPPPASPLPAEPPVPTAAVQPATTAPPPSTQPKTITSGIEYIQAPQPEYPPIAKRMGEEGKAVLRVLVNEKGRPEHVEIQKSSGSARLDEAARQAVLRALFKPFTEDGKAVAAFAIVPIKFQLD